MGEAKRRGDRLTRVLQAMEVAEAKRLAVVEKRKELIRKEAERVEAMTLEDREAHLERLESDRRRRQTTRTLLVTALGMSYAGRSRNRP